MNLLSLISDEYERKALLYPALLLIAPPVLTVVALLSWRMSHLQSALSVCVGLGGSFFLTQLARDSGKKREAALFASWGGVPSVSILRHRDPRIDALTKARYHKRLTSLVKGTKSPSKEAEEEDPSGSDEVYAAWSHFLRTNTRDRKKFPLLFNELINYGYRRNVWGVRPIGIAVSALSAVVSILAVVCAWSSERAGLVLSGVFSGGLVLFWIFVFSERWVRVPADAYAERLLESVETLK